MMERQDTEDRFNPAGRAEQMSRHRLGGTDGNLIGLLAKNLFDRARLNRIRMIALNIDRGLVSRVGRDGWAAVPADAREGLSNPAPASPGYLRELAGVSDPEEKRRIIGREFVHVFQAEAAKLANTGTHAKWLAQGTIYPDVIESAAAKTKKAHTIKSHHNVGGLPDTLHLKLLEPLRELFKDEVRALGRELGLPEDIVGRHPFPGPGLAIRLPGEITPEKQIGRASCRERV